MKRSLCHPSEFAIFYDIITRKKRKGKRKFGGSNAVLPCSRGPPDHASIKSYKNYKEKSE